MPDGMSECMPEGMPEGMPECQIECQIERQRKCQNTYQNIYMSDRTSEYMSDKRQRQIECQFVGITRRKFCFFTLANPMVCGHLSKPQTACA